MPDERARRLALNEAAFRVANERMAEWPERREDDTPANYYCECAEPECRERIALAVADYEALRSDPMQFAVVPGHELPDVETVVQRTDRFNVIRKNEDVRALAEGTDPRGGNGGALPHVPPA